MTGGMGWFGKRNTREKKTRQKRKCNLPSSPESLIDAMYWPATGRIWLCDLTCGKKMKNNQTEINWCDQLEGKLPEVHAIEAVTMVRSGRQEVAVLMNDQAESNDVSYDINIICTRHKISIDTNHITATATLLMILWCAVKCLFLIWIVWRWHGLRQLSARRMLILVMVHLLRCIKSLSWMHQMRML